MIVTREMYGCDADGNRGEIRTFAELEPNDIDWIQEHIREQFDPVDYPNTKYYNVINEDEDGREFEFEVSIKDWFTEEEIQELQNENQD